MPKPALFLDRDGVLNVRTPGEYVKTPDEWIPVEGLERAMRLLRPLFEPIVVVTNQAGIGKGLMQAQDLENIHTKMQLFLRDAGTAVDKFYHCPHRSDAGCGCRKPATGMAWLALADFPQIEFENAWMVGDSLSDIAFGKHLGMRTVLVGDKPEESAAAQQAAVDFRFPSLLAFASYLSGADYLHSPFSI